MQRIYFETLIPAINFAYDHVAGYSFAVLNTNPDERGPAADIYDADGLRLTRVYRTFDTLGNKKFYVNVIN